MPKPNILLFLFCLVFLLAFPSLVFSQEESITITTYYPSPYGSYNSLQTDKLGVGDNNSDGSLTSADVPTTTGNVWIKGNVGIGTTSPSSKLDVSGTVQMTGFKMSTGAANGYILTSDASGVGTWQPNMGGGGGGGGEGLGAIHGVGTANYVAKFTDPNNISNTLIYNTGSNVGIGTTEPGYTLTVNGTAWCASGAWIGSDLRWKGNIKTLDNPLDKLLRLRGVTFDWKHNEFKGNNFPEERQIGIIAQEMEQEFPELVTTDKAGYKAIAYERFTAVLLEAIKAQQQIQQKQQREIEDLKAEIHSLKGKL